LAAAPKLFALVQTVAWPRSIQHKIQDTGLPNGGMLIKNSIPAQFIVGGS